VDFHDYAPGFLDFWADDRLFFDWIPAKRENAVPVDIKEKSN